MRGRNTIMKFYNNYLWTNFKHIYIEKSVKDHYNTQIVLEKIKNATIIEIDNYKEVFSRTKQNASIQKLSKKLILAKKEEPFIYKGSSMCENYGYNHFYYVTTMMNCIYNCEYCYLLGMYTTGNIVIFVNQSEIFSHIEKEILQNQEVYISTSYDSDILAFESILPFTRNWITFAKRYNKSMFEIRTKSSNFRIIQDIKPINNIILSFTISPREIIQNFEKGTSSLESRLQAIKLAINKGWKVRLCFDPMLWLGNNEFYNDKFLDEVFKNIKGESLLDVTLGVFRIPSQYLKKMLKIHSNSVILNYPFQKIGDNYVYHKVHKKQLVDSMKHKLINYVSREKIIISEI